MLLYFNNYETALELIISILYQKLHKELIMNVNKKFSIEGDTTLIINQIYKKMSLKEKDNYTVFRGCLSMLGCDVPKPKNKISFYQQE